MTIDEATVAEWRAWIGRTETRSERLDGEALRRFAAAIGEDLDVARRWPSLGHWAFFLPVVAADEVGEDGHPRRGGFLPPISLPRRMFASAAMQFHAPLVAGEEAVRTSTIRDLRHRSGASGTLVLLDVEQVYAQAGGACLTEVQTIVYREAGGTTPAVLPAVDAPEGERWGPTEADLFRFSAATFNGHRIHYDLPYATGVEGYPALVVHGPFTAARLFGVARRAGEPAAFSFRAQAPLFLGQPAFLAARPDGAVAIRADGVEAMVAKTSH